jgi:hypothetical protein
MTLCEKCEQREHEEKILKSQEKLGCSKCSSNSCSLEMKPTKAENPNSEVTDQHEIDEINKRIDAEISQRHKEAIDGYDKQLQDCMTDLAKFSTKMLIMFEDYKKKGDLTSMVTLLEAIRNHAYLSQTTSSVLIVTSNMLIGKMQGSQ